MGGFCGCYFQVFTVTDKEVATTGQEHRKHREGTVLISISHLL